MKKLILLIVTLVSLQASATENLANIYIYEVKIFPSFPTWTEDTFNNFILNGEYGEESQLVKEIIIKNKKLYFDILNKKFIKNLKSQLIDLINTEFTDTELETAIQYISLARKLDLRPKEKTQILKIKKTNLHIRIIHLNDFLLGNIYSSYGKIVNEFFIKLTPHLNSANIFITKENNGNYVFTRK